MSEMEALPIVGRILGAQVNQEGTPNESTVVVQYTSRYTGDKRWDLKMPFLDAMYLLNILKEIQRRTGFEMPDDPRLP